MHTTDTGEPGSHPEAALKPNPVTADGDRYQVLQVKYGDRVTRKSIVFHDFASTGEEDSDQPMDYSFWVLRNDKAVVLVDTGYPIDEFDWLGEISRTPSPEGLALLGIDPADVTMVIATHFHYDHIGYIDLFTNAQVVAARAEYEFWIARMAENNLEGEFATVKDVSAIREADTQGRLRLVDDATQVAPGITVYPVGGHCPGQLLTLVESNSGPLIVASDAIHLAEQVEKDWPFFAHTDLEEMRAALVFARNLAAETKAAIIPGHDPIIAATYPALAGPAAAVATVLG